MCVSIQHCIASNYRTQNVQVRSWTQRVSVICSIGTMSQRSFIYVHDKNLPAQQMLVVTAETDLVSSRDLGPDACTQNRYEIDEPLSLSTPEGPHSHALLTLPRKSSPYGQCCQNNIEWCSSPHNLYIILLGSSPPCDTLVLQIRLRVDARRFNMLIRASARADDDEKDRKSFQCCHELGIPQPRRWFARRDALSRMDFVLRCDPSVSVHEGVGEEGLRVLV